MKVRCLGLTILVLVALAIPACMKDAKSQIVGKWEATLSHKRTNTDTKVLWEFMPDGTFTAAPWVDPTAIVDKDKYEVSADGQTVKIRSQLMDNATLTFEGSTMFGETPEYNIKFKKL